jgi:hypothetical protein
LPATDECVHDLADGAGEGLRQFARESLANADLEVRDRLGELLELSGQ